MRPVVLPLAVGLLALAACDQQGVLPGQTPSALSTYQEPAHLVPTVGALERQAGNADQTATPIAWSTASIEDAGRIDEMRQLGIARRRESAELRAAEESACTGLAEVDRDASPFFHRSDYLSVEPIERGVRAHFRHVQGLDADWLAHVVDCQIARDEVIGADAPETKDCPLAVKGATAHVNGERHGYAIEVRANDPASVEEIARRARALAR
jgi:hypothetical protein